MSIYHELLKDYPAAYVVRRMFGGDKGAAAETAERIVQTHARPPAWCRELVAPRGWRDMQGRRRF